MWIQQAFHDHLTEHFTWKLPPGMHLATPRTPWLDDPGRDSGIKWGTPVTSQLLAQLAEEEEEEKRKERECSGAKDLQLVQLFMEEYHKGDLHPIEAVEAAMNRQGGDDLCEVCKSANQSLGCWRKNSELTLAMDGRRPR